MKKYLSIVAVAALFGFSAGTMPSYAGPPTPPPTPSPTEEKDKKPSAPHADDDKSGEKKKDERSGR
jgi:hypothetical protein